MLREEPEMKYAFMNSYSGTFRVTAMSRVFQVSRSGFYAWRKRVNGLLPGNGLGAIGCLGEGRILRTQGASWCTRTDAGAGECRPIMIAKPLLTICAVRACGPRPQ